MPYDSEFKNEVRRFQHENPDLSITKISQSFGISERSTRRWLKEEINFSDDRLKQIGIDELIGQNVKLAKQKQKQQDLNRIERKSFREYARQFNVINEFEGQLIKIISNNNLSDLTINHKKSNQEVVGILQLSDLHFNEQINLKHNKYNFEIASKRLKKFVIKAKKIFESNGVTSVVVAMTGDLLNSDRRLDELLENSTNRSKAVFIAVDIIQQIILDLNKDYNITVASVCGNESRVGKDVGWADQVASDSYDFVIHQTLLKLFEGSKGVQFHKMIDSLEHVIEVNGKHILLIHGHNGVANNNNIEPGVSKIISRYAIRDVKIDYVLMGHIHNANIGDFYARSSGLPGANAYSEKALNLYSGASQNIFCVSKDGIDGMKIDLQDADDYEPYTYNKELEAYHSKSEDKANDNNRITIHRIVI